jgi:hypothetical protein
MNVWCMVRARCPIVGLVHLLTEAVRKLYACGLLCRASCCAWDPNGLCLLCLCRWGAETAHATLKDHPHLLASSLDSVDKNSEGLQQLLGCSEQQLHRLVRTSRCALPVASLIYCGHLTFQL